MKPLSSCSDNMSTCTLDAYAHKYEHWEVRGGLTLSALRCQKTSTAKLHFPLLRKGQVLQHLKLTQSPLGVSHCKALKQKGRCGLGDRGAAKHQLALSQSQPNASGLRGAPGDVKTDREVHEVRRKRGEGKFD